MDDPVLPHQDERSQELGREPSDERRRKAGKGVGFDELVEVDGEELGRDAKVVSEVERLNHSDDVVLLVRVLQKDVNRPEEVWNASSGHSNSRTQRKKEKREMTHPFPQVLQNLDLDKCLMMEPLLVSDDLDSDRFPRSMISALQYLAKRPFAEEADDLVPISEVVSLDEEVISAIVVVSVVVGRLITRRRFLLGVRANVVNPRVFDNLGPFKIGKGVVVGFHRRCC